MMLCENGRAPTLKISVNYSVPVYSQLSVVKCSKESISPTNSAGFFYLRVDFM